MNIIFWLDYPLLHISPLIKALSNYDHLQVIVITEKAIPDWRLETGFSYPDFGDAFHYEAPDFTDRSELIKNNSCSDSVHIFYGIRSTPENFKAFKCLKSKECRVGFYLEPRRIDRSIKSYFRLAFYKLFFSKHKRNIDFILATGRLGISFYEIVGFPKKRIYEFGYFLPLYERQAGDRSGLSVTNADNIDNKVKRIVFVGQLNDRKNLWLLLAACKKLKDDDIKFHLTVIGTGPLQSKLIEWADRALTSSDVSFLGNLPREITVDIIAQQSLLVLPSKYDGWGAVASEALSSGTPILISDKCGASSMINGNDLVGRVFKSNNLQDIYRLLRCMLLSDKLNTGKANLFRQEYFKNNWSDIAGVEKILSVIEKDYD